MIIYDIQQGSEAWFQLKLSRFSGSRFAKLMAGIKTDTYSKLISDIAMERCTGVFREEFVNYSMQEGTEKEPYARSDYPYGEVQEIGFVTFDEDHPLFDWVGFSPDGFIDADGLYEAKCPEPQTQWQRIQKNVFPSTYKWQVQGGLWVTGKEYCDFMSWHEKMKPFIIRVFPDLEMHKQLEQRIYETIPLVEKEIENYNRYNYENMQAIRGRTS